jgi:putative tricarboxylic transport membrane protein
MLSTRKKTMLLFVSALFSFMLFAGCGGKDKSSSSENSSVNNSTPTSQAKNGDKKYEPPKMEFVAPSSAGGGWDKTIRAVESVLKSTKLISAETSVSNAVGNGGVTFLEKLQEKKGTDNSICVYSPPLILNNLSGKTPLTYKDTTPISMLISDYQVFIVKDSSKFASFKDIMNALSADSKSVKIGGTSGKGSLDHIAFLLVAKEAGVKDLKNINYTVMPDVKNIKAQLDAGLVDVYSTGLADGKDLLKEGGYKALAVSSDHKIKGDIFSNIPTCKEAGINIVFENWRGIFGPPNMSEEASKYWEEKLSKMIETPEWKKACDDNGWDNRYKNKKDFTDFISQKETEMKTILKDIEMLK